ncbi:MAG: iron ABC transporter permease [Acidimicrobiia bacterium]|nr:iron ABC transporter permease [Acidimicrobiia bacterium]
MVEPVAIALPGRRRGMGRILPAGTRIPVAVWLPATAVAVGSVLPAAVLAITALSGDRNAWSTLVSTRTLELTARSVGLAAAVTATTLVIAIPLALVLTRTDVPGRGFLTVGLNLPLVIPSFVGAFAFLSAFGPTGMLRDLLGADRIPDLTGFVGSWAALSLFTYPYVLLPTLAALRDQDPSVEDAARSLGVSPTRLWRRVALPQAKPAITAGALMVSLYTLSDFGVPSIMRFDTFTRVIYDQYEFGDRSTAAALALVLVLITLVVVAVQIRVRGPLRLESTAPGARRHRDPTRIGIWRWPAAGAAALVMLASVGVTAFVLLWWTATGLARGNPLGSGFGTELLGATTSSLGLSLVVAVLAVAAVLPVAIVVVRHPGRFASTLENLTWASHGLPGLVIALAFVAVTIAWLPAMYQTIYVLVVALCLHFLPQALGATQAALGRMNPHLEEASRGLGRTWSKTLFTVTLPLLLRGLVAGAALVFLNVMKELPVTLLLRPIGFDTLAIRVWEPAVDGFYTKAGIAGLVLILVASLPMAVVAIPEWHRAR